MLRFAAALPFGAGVRFLPDATAGGVATDDDDNARPSAGGVPLRWARWANIAAVAMASTDVGGRRRGPARKCGEGAPSAAANDPKWGGPLSGADGHGCTMRGAEPRAMPSAMLEMLLLVLVVPGVATALGAMANDPGGGSCTGVDGMSTRCGEPDGDRSNVEGDDDDDDEEDASVRGDECTSKRRRKKRPPICGVVRERTCVGGVW